MRFSGLILAVTVLIFGGLNLKGQDASYFPPLTGDDWENIDPESLEWCSENIENLDNFLDATNTKAFMVLKDGRIVLELYFDEFVADSVWYWASAGKTIAAVLTGAAQEEGFLSLNDPVATYLGAGWTNCTPTEEAQRLVYHQLTMSSGFNTFPLFWDCTTPECFNCSVEPGTQWHYHNGVYRQLVDVIEAATGLTRNQYTTAKIKNKIGMGGFWFDDLYISTARDMARFGLLALNDFVWDGDPILEDMAYIEAMRNTALPDNEAYGYLWWLNGKNSHYTPLDFELKEGFLIPSAPADLYAGMGANDQRVYVVPSENMVVVRLGNVAFEDAAAVSTFDDLLWQHLMDLACAPMSVSNGNNVAPQLMVYPNPTSGNVYIDEEVEFLHVKIFNLKGVKIWHGNSAALQDGITLPSGFYIIDALSYDGVSKHAKLLVK
jgi:CubicO group peptidase (beta-lactamase class C family)